MAETVAHYSFLPWLRQGLGAEITEADTLGQAAGAALERAQLQVELTLHGDGLDGTTSDQIIAKLISIVGPGDMKNISERVVVSHNPRRNVTNYEANNLAYIEFYEEDFLWRYTPARPNAANAKRLRPWLALIVLKEDEFKMQQLPDTIPFISIRDEAFSNVFHEPGETWAFAHVHFNQLLEKSNLDELKQEVTAELQADPDTALCRLLCPRKLQVKTFYTACLIPAFETGRRTGLGLDPAGVSAQESSWIKTGQQTAKPRGLDFPVYYQWNFATGINGDFESLVAKLKPIVMDPENGMMPMDVQEIGYGMDEMMERKTMGMEAALRPPTFEKIRENFPVTPKEIECKDRLTDFLNLSPSINRPVNSGSDTAENPFYSVPFSKDPMIVPPLYGAWHGLAEDLKTGTNWPWFLELNTDFRNRAAAGLGTQVIQNNQEDFMNRAWQQVGRINEANQKLREAQLNKMINNAIYKKHVLSAQQDKFFMTTNAVQHVTFNADKSSSVNHQINQSRIPLAAQSAAFQKLTRNTGKTKSFKLAEKVISNLNKPESDATGITAAKLKTAPTAALDIATMDALVNDAISFYTSDIINTSKDLYFNLLKDLTAPDLMQAKTELQAKLTAQTTVSAAVKTNVTNLINNMQLYQKTVSNEITVHLSQPAYEAGFDDFSAGKTYDNTTVLNEALLADPIAKIGTSTSGEDVKEFKTNLGKFGTQLGTLPQLKDKSPIADLTGVRINITAQLQPSVSFSRRIKNNIKIWDGNEYKPAKELKPVMVYPEFPDPTYEFLKKISQNFILPNVDKLPNNCITLLETNQRFIESFLAGMNHEMARELLWREYPTDQRGSCFRQFWNIKDNLFQEDPEKIKDIDVMDKWTEALGSHRPVSDKDILVLVVRGELFKKYPNTMVYAQKAAYDTSNPSLPRKLPENITQANTKFPLFKADLEPDITLFGFDLTAEIANGDRILHATDPITDKNPGWFFVFKERPGQVQFGLDDYTTETGDTSQMPTGMPATWNQFCWEHLVTQKNDLQNYQLNFSSAINIGNPGSVAEKYFSETPGWGTNSAEIASILYQDPVLFARHAGEMLNEELLNQ
jgi:hypothetical protein